MLSWWVWIDVILCIGGVVIDGMLVVDRTDFCCYVVHFFFGKVSVET